MKPLIVMAALSSFILTGCATHQSVTVQGKALCGGAWKQINVRPGDKLTDQTAIEVEGNNLAREAIGCPYEPPTKTKVAAKA